MSGHRYNTKVGYAPAPRTAQSAVEAMQTINLRQFDGEAVVEAGAVVVNTGQAVTNPTSSGTGQLTSVWLLDVDATLETALSATSSFTIGGPSSGADAELVNNTGPAGFSWSAEGVTAGRVNLRLILPGYVGIVPFDPGGAPWTWTHSGSGDAMNTLTVTKPAGAPIPADLGDFKSRIYLEIQQPG